MTRRKKTSKRTKTNPDLRITGDAEPKSMKKSIFPFGEAEIDYLKKRDPRLGEFIDSVGLIECPVTPDLFVSLAGNFISQQISTSAANSIFGRFENLCHHDICPERVASMDIMDIKTCGMSLKKASYIQSLAQKIVSGEFSLDDLAALSDEEVISKLVSLKGVGVWTAEMLLIFSLCRPNVLSYGDLGIRNGILKLYSWKTFSRHRYSMLLKRYTPYASIASLYLWRSAGMR